MWSCCLPAVVQTHEKLSAWGRAEGLVSSLEYSTTDAEYRVCYRFEVEGVSYEGKQSVASNPPAYHRGEKLTVVYNPAHPYESDVDSAFDLYFKSFGFALVGVMMFLIGFSAMGGWAWLKELAFSRGRA